jgi:hypothetical protein
MIKADKTLERMRNNPRDWSIDDLKTLAKGKASIGGNLGPVT